MPNYQVVSRNEISEVISIVETKVSAKIGELADDTIASKLSETKNELRGEIRTLSNKFPAGKVLATTDDVQSLDQRITTLTATVGNQKRTIDSSINKVKTDSNTLIKAVKDKADKNESTINTLTSRLNTISTTANTASTTAANASKNIDGTTSKIRNLESQVSSINGRLVTEARVSAMITDRLNSFTPKISSPSYTPPAIAKTKCPFPIGTVILTATYSSPANRVGGRWEDISANSKIAKNAGDRGYGIGLKDDRLPEHREKTFMESWEYPDDMVETFAFPGCLGFSQGNKAWGTSYIWHQAKTLTAFTEDWIDQRQQDITKIPLTIWEEGFGWHNDWLSYRYAPPKNMLLLYAWRLISYNSGNSGNGYEW